MKPLLIEGWRGYAQSYAVVNQFQCLALLHRGVEFAHRDLPPPTQIFGTDTPWKQSQSLFSAEATERLLRIEGPDAAAAYEVVYRIAVPLDFRDGMRARRTFVFAVTEAGYLDPHMIAGGRTLVDALSDGNVTLVTPSNWSKAGLVASGAPADGVAVVPHGFDPGLYRPPGIAERNAARREFGWSDRFVFLNVSAMSGTKGIGPLLKAFAAVAAGHPKALLALKGLDAAYPSRRLLATEGRSLSRAEAELVGPRVIYVGKTLSFAEMARLYHAADVLAAPYLAEGFNLPVLEAAASGLPVICTGNGPTDDFTNADFARHVRSTITPVENGVGRYLEPEFGHLVELMTAAVGGDAAAIRALGAGPEYLRTRFTWDHAAGRLLDVIGLTSGS